MGGTKVVVKRMQRNIFAGMDDCKLLQGLHMTKLLPFRHCVKYRLFHTVVTCIGYLNIFNIAGW